MDIDPEITTANGFHIENVPTRFVSGFTRWIEEHADLRRSDAAVLIEMCGFLARTEGLDEEALHIVAGLTGAAPQEIVRIYRKDNTRWAETQAVLDAQDLTNLDEHLDGIGRWG
ncbi:MULTISPECIES: hypothetical protein [unclassified Streptomyces]|uniref:hypothetical protein n=1 Tax=unclassified Streptomyces TaxID=2593676 RepID=UPI00081E216C|nr:MULTISPECIES: hypothetical protein [unclassified Streptomyces]MYZ40061.1 hypothetical protein [Streptomyces sp. SID4917]SCG06407.1 hypothetical protein GA0115259_110272 [Streptomyces sp. MnatMP-M17]